MNLVARNPGQRLEIARENGSRTIVQLGVQPRALMRRKIFETTRMRRWKSARTCHPRKCPALRRSKRQRRRAAQRPGWNRAQATVRTSTPLMDRRSCTPEALEGPTCGAASACAGFVSNPSPSRRVWIPGTPDTPAAPARASHDDRRPQKTFVALIRAGHFAQRKGNPRRRRQCARLGFAEVAFQGVMEFGQRGIGRALRMHDAGVNPCAADSEL